MTGITGPVRASRRMALRAISICICVIHWEGVAEAGVIPGAGVVALGALPREMVRRSAVAGLAVRGPGCLVVKGRIPPIRSVVALGTLSGEVVGWFIFTVTGLAIGSAGRLVVEGRIPPIRSVVALGTLSGGMVGRSILAVAGLAIGSAGCLVVEGCIAPVRSVMALGALS